VIVGVWQVGSFFVCGFCGFCGCVEGGEGGCRLCFFEEVAGRVGAR
jgi:hypothetical protein